MVMDPIVGRRGGGPEGWEGFPGCVTLYVTSAQLNFFALRFEIWISNFRIFLRLFLMIRTNRKQVNGRGGILASS